jgi:crotonobetainyl-CoA:carnitine CoA-transferase CaiB-like acyl-CoA transferase
LEENWLFGLNGEEVCRVSKIRDLKVVDLSHALAGPFCTMLLADMGAEVIKIERPEGDHFRPAIGGGYNAAVNRNKLGICLDLKQDSAKEVVRRLIRRGDVVVESFTPGTVDRLGLGFEASKEINPKIIFCSISGYGQTGPYRELPGYDVTAQAMAGIMMCTGEPDRPPVRIGPSLIDIGAGMYVVIGILQALMERDQNGQAQRIEVSLLETALSWMSPFIARYSMNGELPQRLGSAWPAAAPYQVYKAKDKYVFVGASTERFWRSLCKILGLEYLLGDPRFSTMEGRIARRSELNEIVENSLVDLTADEIVTKLRTAGIPCSPVMNLGEILQDPHVKERGLLTELEHPEYGPIIQTRTPIVRSGNMPEIRSGAPLLGQHTLEVLNMLRYSEPEIEALVSSGAAVPAKRRD